MGKRNMQFLSISSAVLCTLRTPCYVCTEADEVFHFCKAAADFVVLKHGCVVPHLFRVKVYNALQQHDCSIVIRALIHRKTTS